MRDTYGPTMRHLFFVSVATEGEQPGSEPDHLYGVGIFALKNGNNGVRKVKRANCPLGFGANPFIAYF